MDWKLGVAALFLCGCSAGAQLGGLAAKALVEGLTRPSSNGPVCGRPCDAGTSCNIENGMCQPLSAFAQPPTTRQPRDLPPDDSCGGLCAENEHCRIVAGADVECIPLASR